MTTSHDQKKPIITCIIDSHMHIQSGACAPLPLVYEQLAPILHFNPRKTPIVRTRDKIGVLICLAKADGGKLQVLDSVAIGNRAVLDNAATYSNLKNSYDFCKPDSDSASHDPAEKSSLPTIFVKDTNKPILLASGQSFRIVFGIPDCTVFCPMIVMPMDMEYAHIAGYEGQTIYHEKNGEVFYYIRYSGINAEELGEKVDLSHEIEKNKKTLKMKKWHRQFSEHSTAAITHPFKLIPLYHYEPRRWRLPETEKTDLGLYSSGTWDYPFSEIATAQNAGIFAGFKMYTPLGYRPLDAKLPFMENYYARCERDRIPIVNHCAAGGMLTHEHQFYKDYIAQGYRHFPQNTPADATSVVLPPIRNNQATIDDPANNDAEEWFLEHYIHPRAWRKVLDKFPNLYLNLAHFGGDDWKLGPECDWISELIGMLADKKYPNLYTDISCFAIDSNMPYFIPMMKEHPELWGKIMFGTDWYLTLLISEGGQQQYDDYCRRMKVELDKIDESIWVRFSFLNPVRFYGFDKPDKVSNMKDALRQVGASNDTVTQHYNKFTKVLSNFEAIQKAL